MTRDPLLDDPQKLKEWETELEGFESCIDEFTRTMDAIQSGKLSSESELNETLAKIQRQLRPSSPVTKVGFDSCRIQPASKRVPESELIPESVPTSPETPPLSEATHAQQIYRAKERGNLLLKQGKYQEAKNAYLQGLQLLSTPEHDCHDVHDKEMRLALNNNLAQVCLYLGEWKEAREAAERVLEGDAGNTKARWRLVQALEKLELIPEALEGVRRLLSSFEDDVALNKKNIGSEGKRDKDRAFYMGLLACQERLSAAQQSNSCLDIPASSVKNPSQDTLQEHLYRFETFLKVNVGNDPSLLVTPQYPNKTLYGLLHELNTHLCNETTLQVLPPPTHPEMERVLCILETCTSQCPSGVLLCYATFARRGFTVSRWVEVLNTRVEDVWMALNALWGSDNLKKAMKTREDCDKKEEVVEWTWVDEWKEGMRALVAWSTVLTFRRPLMRALMRPGADSTSKSNCAGGVSSLVGRLASVLSLTYNTAATTTRDVKGRKHDTTSVICSFLIENILLFANQGVPALFYQDRAAWLEVIRMLTSHPKSLLLQDESLEKSALAFLSKVSFTFIDFQRIDSSSAGNALTQLYKTLIREDVLLHVYQRENYLILLHNLSVLRGSCLSQKPSVMSVLKVPPSVVGRWARMLDKSMIRDCISGSCNNSVTGNEEDKNEVISLSPLTQSLWSLLLRIGEQSSLYSSPTTTVQYTLPVYLHLLSQHWGGMQPALEQWTQWIPRHPHGTSRWFHLFLKCCMPLMEKNDDKNNTAKKENQKQLEDLHQQVRRDILLYLRQYGDSVLIPSLHNPIHQLIQVPNQGESKRQNDKKQQPAAPRRQELSPTLQLSLTNWLLIYRDLLRLAPMMKNFDGEVASSDTDNKISAINSLLSPAEWIQFLRHLVSTTYNSTMVHNACLCVGTLLQNDALKDKASMSNTHWNSEERKNALLLMHELMKRVNERG